MMELELNAGKLSPGSELVSNAYKSLSELIKGFVETYKEMKNFNLRKALDCFQKLSAKQRNTGWVLSKLGQCFFTVGKYKEAVTKFQEAFKIEPYRLEGREYYSSCLWHLDETNKLCDLAFNSFDLDPFSPETWVAMGNCYSKFGEHEAAKKFFLRSIELDKNFSYAHCLRGHEFASTDRF